MKLPEPSTKGEMSLEETLAGRRSKRRFASRELTWEQVSQLLWSAQGITDHRRGLRTAPSAGATYPLELYLVTPEGVFHYHPGEHAVEKTIADDVRPALARASLRQKWIADASVSIVIAAVYERVGTTYGPRGNRYTHIEVGHAAQNIHLQAIALGLGSVPIGAFQDEEVRKVLSLPPEQQPLYIIAVGHVAE